MGVRLTITLKGGSAPPQSVILEEDAITLGRDQACEVVLAQAAVSRHHARITREGTLYFIEDLGSSFGTQLNDEHVPKLEKRLLRNNDVIGVAQFDVIFERVADVASDDTEQKTSHLARKAIQTQMKGLGASPENAFFRVMNGSAEGQRIEIADAQEYVFGRDSADADIVLKDDLVSRKHAKVRRDWSGTHIEDLESRNGIRINKKRVLKATLKDKDELTIGSVRLLYIDPSEVREESFSRMEKDELSSNTRSVPDTPKEDPPTDTSPPQVEPAPSTENEAPDEVPEPEPELDAEESFQESSSLESNTPGTGRSGQVVALSIGVIMVLVGVVLLVMLFIGW